MAIFLVQTSIEQLQLAIAVVVGCADLDCMQDAFDDAERELRWHITSVYNYDVQNELNDALTKARDEADAVCDQRNAAFEAYLTNVESTWATCVLTKCCWSPSFGRLGGALTGGFLLSCIAGIFTGILFHGMSTSPPFRLCSPWGASKC